MVDFDTRKNIEIVKRIAIWKIEASINKKQKLFIGIIQPQTITGCLVFKGIEVKKFPETFEAAKEIIEIKENQIEHLYPLDKIQECKKYSQTT